MLKSKPERRIQLRFSRKLAPGDYVVTTALLRDIQLLHPGRYSVGFETSLPTVYAYNPHASSFDLTDTSVELLEIGYMPGINACRQGEVVHFTSWLHREFQQLTGIAVHPVLPRPDLYLSDYHKNTRPLSGRYWVVFGGGKTDFTVKHWDYSRYREVVQQLKKQGITCVQSGAVGESHVHPAIPEAVDLVGWGYLREMFWQIYHADGVICPVTCAMHVAAAFEKPCVVVAGGRENWTWEAYTNDGQFGERAEPVNVPHRFLHTIGQLPCCKTVGCWRNKLVATKEDQSVCQMPAVRPVGAQPLPECMRLITVDQVVDAVLSYYRDGTLPGFQDADRHVQLLVQDVPWQPQATHGQPAVPEEQRPVSTRRPGLGLHHPKIGGRVTILAYLNGRQQDEYANYHLLQHVMSTVPRLNLDLRVFLSSPTPAARSRLASLPAATFESEAVTGKAAAMRHLLQNAKDLSRYVIWMVGGMKIMHAGWLDQLCESILLQGPQVAAYGMKRQHLVDGNSPLAGFEAWMKTRPWYQGQPLRQDGYGTWVNSLDDWFLVLRRDAIDKIGIPDETLMDDGLGLVLGEQLHQHNFQAMSFNVGYSCFQPPRTTSPELIRGKVPWQQPANWTAAGPWPV